MYKKFTLRNFYSFLALVLLLFSANKGFAQFSSGYAAADLYVDYIGTGPTDLKYRVNLVVYTVCTPSTSSVPAKTETVNVTSNTCYAPKYIPVTLYPGTTDTVDQLCPAYSSLNSCNSASATYPGYTVTNYSDTISVPKACSDWVFIWNTSNSRLPGDDIDNLHPDPALIAGIDNTQRYNASTPRYAYPALPAYLCANQHVVYPTGPYDPDGADSLSTADGVVYYSTGVSANYGKYNSGLYNLGFDQFHPVNATASDPYTVDPGTGEATFTSSTAGKYVVGFSTTSYDYYTGNKIAYNDREVNYSVITCTAPYPPPTIDTTPQSLVGGNLEGYDTIDVCPGTLLKFNINAVDTVSSLFKLYMSSNSKTTIPGSSFSTAGSGTASVKGTFSWTPTGSDIGIHTIVFTASDSSCLSSSDPVVAKSYSTVIIKVLSSIYAGEEYAYCGPTSLPGQLFVVGPPGTSYTWTDSLGGFPLNLSNPNIDSPTTTWSGPGIYKYVVSINTSVLPVACKLSDTVTVKAYSPITINVPTPPTICANQSATLSYTATPAGFDTLRTWSPAATLSNPFIVKPIATPIVTTNYKVIVEDKNTCRYKDSTTVTVKGVAPIVHIIPKTATICPQASINLFASASTQVCGPGIPRACTGATINIDQGKMLSNGSYNFPTYDPDPFYYMQGEYGGRMQILYTAADLNTAGISAGNINSIAFNVTSKQTPAKDSFIGYTIKIACTGDKQVSSNKFNNYSFATVFPSTTINTVKGWNTFNFPTPYYWDGSSNLVVEVCYGIKADGNCCNFIGDNTALVNTNYTSTFYYEDYCCYTTSGTVYQGCGFTPAFDFYSSTKRPETEFNSCSPTSFTYKWSPSRDLNSTTIPDPTSSGLISSQAYTVQVSSSTDPGCVGSDTAFIIIDTTNSVTAIPHSQILCRPGYFQLDAVGHGPKKLLNLPCGTDNPVSCVNSSTANIFGNPTSYSFEPPFEEEQMFTQFIITAQDLKNGGLQSGTLKELDMYVDPSSATSGFPNSAFDSITISIGCTNKTSFTNSNDFVNVGMTLVYVATGPVTLGIGEVSFPFNISTYNWDTTQNLIVQICYGSPDGSFHPAFMTYTNTPYTSMISKEQFGSGDECSGTFSGFTFGTLNYRPIVSFQYCQAPQDSEFHFTWSPGTYLSDSTVHNPVAYVPNSAKYYVYTEGRNKCLVHDSVSLYVPVHNFTVAPIDTSLCAGGKVQFVAKGGFKYQWYQNGYQPATTLSCTTCANPIATPTDTTTYQVVVSDSVSCSDTLTAEIDIKPIPDVRIVNHDTTITIGSSVQLYATGATTYSWWPATALNNPNIVNPVATPQEPMKYVVTGIGQDGCSASDSVNIRINTHGLVYVPSAFSPNGDGKNDVFRVANLTIEKIVEFRIYNRWGQEVFKSEDNKGWDGTWNGVPQDIDSYNYVIRVGMPDGTLETFKGSVTLVR
ncbi:MAG TPA: gliding motility-associated C-terminal domain-containing protein [Flavipsychrobacter sp.]|nr:gliding motility-associated C-terminal domain-containing protein [Flavipsychrobacter sp.]